VKQSAALDRALGSSGFPGIFGGCTHSGSRTRSSKHSTKLWGRASR